MAAFARTEQDVLGLARSGGQAAVQLFVVRSGKLIGRDVFLLDADPSAGDDEVLAGFVDQYYARATSVPPALLVPTLPADAADLEAFLAARRGRRVRLLVPQRGEKRRLVELAGRNAAETLAREQARWLADEGKTLVRARGAGGRAGPAGPADADRVLRHHHVPGEPDGRQHGRLRGGQAADGRVPPLPDPRRRRPGRLREPRGDAAAPPPSREGGRGGERRGAALGAAGPDRRGRRQGPAERGRGGPRGAGLAEIPIVGLAKEREELFLPGRPEPVVLPATSPALYLVQRLRDEAHRFAITYHRDLRRKAAVKSRLRRPARRRTGPQARAAAHVRLGEARPGGAGRADRGGAGDRPGARGADQGGPRRVAARGSSGARGGASAHGPVKAC